MRKVIQISTAVCERHGGWLVVLCDDGTLWNYGAEICGWEKLPDIPQPKEATSKIPPKIDIDNRSVDGID